VLFDVAGRSGGEAGVESVEGRQVGSQASQVLASLLQQPQLHLAPLIIIAQIQVLAYHIVPGGQRLYEDVVVVAKVDLMSQQGQWHILNLHIRGHAVTEQG